MPAFRLRLVASLLPFTVVLPAFAQQAPTSITLPPLVVTASGLPTPEDELGSSVSVVTADDITRAQARTMADVLQTVPGLAVFHNGGPGGLTAIYLRGTNTFETKVLVDGIDVKDPSSVNGAFDFSQLDPAAIERVEVLRGPQSGLYGADAMGGVVNVITKAGSGPPLVTAMMEGGSFGTFNQAVGLSGSAERLSYAFNAIHLRQDDSVVTPTGFAPAGTKLSQNSSDSRTISTKLGFQALDTLDFGLVSRYAVTNLHYTSDDFTFFPAVAPEPETSTQDETSSSSRATAHWVLLDGKLDQTWGVGVTTYRTYSFDPNNDFAFGAVTPTVTVNNPAIYSGTRLKVDWRGAYEVVRGQTATVGLEHQIDSIRDTTPIAAQTRSNAGYLQLQSEFGSGFYNLASARYDSNSRFGDKPTWREAPSYTVAATGTHLKASAGTAFVAPTLDELYNNYPAFFFVSNPNLKPETSFGYDAGFEQPLAAAHVSFGSTWFHNDIANLIASKTNPVTFIATDVNVGRATTEGLESFVSWQPTEAVKLRADHTYTLAENDITHSELQHRPMHKASLTGSWQVTPAASLSTSIIYVGAWQDIGRDGGNVEGGPYTLVNLAGSYDLGHGLSTFARIDNLLDRKYQEPAGFLAPGFGVFAGISVAFGGPAH